MDTLASFIAMDRRQALARGGMLPDRSTGAALLADISGFTALTEALVHELGSQRGAEELTHVLNLVYDTLVAEIDRYGGSVVGFSGDAVTCWFDGDPGVCAATCALALQAAVAAFAAVPLPGGGTASLAVKVAVVAGPARRFVVGDPEHGLLDVLAGPTVERLGVVEELAGPGEVLVEATAAAALEAAGPDGTWRTDLESGVRVLALSALAHPADPRPWPPLAPDALAEEQVRPWLLPAVWERLRYHKGAFLAELRPAVPLFLRFGGLDYERPIAGTRLDTYIRWVQDVLVRYEGFLIDLTIGDKGSYLYAAFGAPVAHDDDAARAVAAALELRSPPTTCSFIRGTQIGISSGEARAGASGGRSRRTYAVRGAAVNLGARLMQAATPGGILVTRAVRQAAGARFSWASLPPLQVKGKTEPVPVFGLVEESAGRGLGLLEPAYFGPLVGRTAELATIAAKLALARSGRGQLIAITGEAGLGKSRLVAEGVRQARAAGMHIYGGAAQSYGMHTPYLAWQSVWRALFDLDPSALPDEQVLDLEDKLAEIDPGLLERLPLIGPALGLAIPDTPLTAGMDPALRKVSLEALLIDCLRARARVTPVLVVLEDIHWLDALSHQLVEAMGRAIPQESVALMLAYRPPDWATPHSQEVMTVSHFTEMRLTGFTAEEAAGLVAARLGAGEGVALPAGLVDQLMDRTEGNPFYLEELLTYLAERGVDPHDPAALTGLDWPASLQSLLLARMDQLSEPQRTILKVGSIIGRRFAVEQLWGVYPDLGEPGAVDGDLATLNRLDLTALDTPDPDRAYLFKHIVTQEVIYESVPHAQRTRLHEQFATWLEQESATAGTPPPLDLLAYHYGQSANAAKQREYFRRAGDAAAAAYANAAAAEYYTRLLERIPESEQGAILLDLGRVLERSGAWAQAASRYSEALARAEATGDARLAGHAQLALGVVRRDQGAWAEAEDWLEQACARFNALEEGIGMSRVLAEMGRLYQLQGDYARARTILEESLALAREQGDQAGIATALTNLGVVTDEQGDHRAAEALYSESLVLRRALNDKPGIALTLTNRARVASTQGDFAPARTLGEESLLLYREIGEKRGIAGALSILGRVVVYQGEYRTAQVLLEESLALERELGDITGMATALHHLALTAWNRGNFVLAREQWEESLRLARQVGHKWSISEALHGLGVLTAVEGDVDTAQALLEESSVLAQELGDKGFVAGSLVGFGVLAAIKGDEATAQARFQETLALSRELGLKWGAAWALNMLGTIAMSHGDYPAAQARIVESLNICRELGAQRLAVSDLVAAAGLEIIAGDATRVVWLLGAATHLLGQLGGVIDPIERRIYEQAEAQAQQVLGAAGFAAAWATGEALSWEDAIAVALGTVPTAAGTATA